MRFCFILLTLVALQLGCAADKPKSQTENKNKSKQSASVANTVGKPTDELQGFDSPEEALNAYYTSVDNDDFETAQRAVIFSSTQYRDQFLQYAIALPRACVP